jgi:hypothetical protein
MTDTPVDFTITRQRTPGGADYVRLECRDHLKVLVRIDIAPGDFTSAIMGEQVIAALSGGEGR